MASVIKIPNQTNGDILEIKRRLDIGVKYSSIKTQYNMTYYDIKRVCRIFGGCDDDDSIQAKKDSITADNVIKQAVDHRANYEKYKDYYTTYNQERQANRIAARLVVVNAPVSPGIEVN